MKPPIYKTDRFELRPYQPQDEDRFVEMSIDPISTQFMGGSIGDESAERELFQKVLNLYKNPTSERWFWIWGIYENEKLIGHFELKETEHTDENELEIVYIVHPEARCKGVMSEILNFFKENQNIWNRRIIATVSPANNNSLKLLENWGIEKKENLKDEEAGKEYYKFVLNKPEISNKK